MTTQPPTRFCKFPAIENRSPADTERMAGILAGFAYGGLLVALTGDLGAGKTVFARALGGALGAGAMRSPTFAIETIHPLPGLSFELVHADLYRLESLREDAEEAIQLEEYLNDGLLLLLEWADRWSGLPVEDRWDVRIVPAGEETRRIELAAYGVEACASLAWAFPRLLDAAVVTGEPACR